MLQVQPLQTLQNPTTLVAPNGEQVAPTPTPTAASASGGLGVKMAQTIMKARQQYPGADDKILEGIIRDNQQTHPEIVSKLQPLLSNARTMRNNNPTAMTTDVAKTLGMKEGVDYTQGDAFGDDRYHTAKFIGDPVESTIKAFDNAASSNTPIFTTAGGKPRWSYINMTNQDWQAMSPQQKADTVAKMKNSEGGGHGYSATQILNSIVSDNPGETQPDSLLGAVTGSDVANNIMENSKHPGQVIGNALKETAGQVGNDVVGVGKSLAATVNGISTASQGFMNNFVPDRFKPKEVSSLPDSITKPTTDQAPGYVGGMIGQLISPLSAAESAESVPGAVNALKSSKLLKIARNIATLKGTIELIKESPAKGLLKTLLEHIVD